MSVTYFANKYGDLEYGDNLSLLEIDSGTRPRISKIPNYPGTMTFGSIINYRSLVGLGTFSPSDLTTFQTELESFVAAHSPGLPRKLQIDDDRYINAEVTDFSILDTKGLPNVNYQVSFICHDPFWIEYDQQSKVLAPSTSSSLTIGGTAPTAVNLSYAVNFIPQIQTDGIVVSIDSEALSFFPPYPSTYNFDSIIEEVTEINNYTAPEDLEFYITTNFFLLLEPGTYSCSYSSDADYDLGDATLTWNDRYL